MSQKDAGAGQGHGQGHVQSQPQTKPGTPRRLGRGLSGLIGPAPVRVDAAPATAETLDSGHQYDITTQHNINVSNRSVPAPESAEGVGPEDRAEGGVVMVAVGEIVPSRFQPRQTFDETKLKELAESIRSVGMMQPVIVRRRKGAEGQRGRGTEGEALADKQPVARYELVAGERRWRAAQIAGLARVPAIVRELDDDECAAWGLIENVQREDLDPIEKGEACRVMMERFGLSPQDLSARLGLDRSTIVNMVRMTELEPSIQTMMRSGTLTMGHARSLLGVASENGLRLALATLVSMEGWSVRKLEQEVKKVAKGKASAQPKGGAAGGLAGVGAGAGASGGGAGRSAALADLEKRLGEHLGTRVKIKTDKTGKRGRIEMAFFDLDHFDGLMQKVGFGK